MIRRKSIPAKPNPDGCIIPRGSDAAGCARRIRSYTMKRAIIETVAADGWALAVVMAVLASGCQREGCPPGTREQWAPEPDRADLRACVASGRSVYLCMRDMGYARVCR